MINNFTLKVLLVIGATFIVSSCNGKESSGGNADEHSKESMSTTNHTNEEHSGESKEVVLSDTQQKMIGLGIEKISSVLVGEKVKILGAVAESSDSVFQVKSESDGTIVETKVAEGEHVGVKQEICKITSGNDIITVYAEHEGVVMHLSAKSGTSIAKGNVLAIIADTAHLSAVFDVYEKDIRHITRGQSIEVLSDSYPDTKFTGIIDFISPSIDKVNRTVKVRVKIKNVNGMLKYNMFVAAIITSKNGSYRLAVPKEAIVSLEGKKYIFIPETRSNFALREISTGQEDDRHTEIVDGIKQGDEFVVRGVFSLKAEIMKGSFEAGHGH